MPRMNIARKYLGPSKPQLLIICEFFRPRFRSLARNIQGSSYGSQYSGSNMYRFGISLGSKNKFHDHFIQNHDIKKTLMLKILNKNYTTHKLY